MIERNLSSSNFIAKFLIRYIEVCLWRKRKRGGKLLDWPELTRLKYFNKIISVHWLQLCHYRGLHSCSARTDCPQQVNQLSAVDSRLID